MSSAILKDVFVYISVPCCSISAKFGERKQNHMQSHVTWLRQQILKNRQSVNRCHVKNRGSAISQHRIKAKFGERKQNHMQSHVTNKRL